MTRAQRIAIARHQAFSDWVFGRLIARLSKEQAVDRLLKRHYMPIRIRELEALKESPLRRAYPLDTPLLSEELAGARTWTFAVRP